jgi:hypothetical protein
MDSRQELVRLAQPGPRNFDGLTASLDALQVNHGECVGMAKFIFTFLVCVEGPDTQVLLKHHS